MRHGRAHYQGIQDPTGTSGIADDEPVFVLRSKDRLAPAAIEHWAQLAEDNGAPQRAEQARAWAEEMRHWQGRNYTQYPPDPDAD